MDLELLLAYADDQRPVLDGGLHVDESTIEAASKDAQVESFLDFSDDPNDLTLQRWAVVAEKGADGDRLLDLIQPLIKQREEDQEAPVRIYRVDAGMNMHDSVKWRKEVYWDESVAREDLPRYMLLLGDLDRVSLELQQTLSGSLLIGRLSCPTDAGYAEYVKKVLRWQNTPAPEAQARAMFFTARDGTAATTIGHRALVSASINRCRERFQKKRFPASEIVEIPYEDAEDARDTFLAEMAKREPSMLFTMSHGLGAPRKGWSTDEQRATQGAICFGPGVRLTAEDIAGRPFLPGGIWFFLACYGGGTPATSAYYHWLKRLRDAGGFGGRVDSVLAGLPKGTDKGFLAALPQAALANPEGPLGIMAHIDLAWTYSFQDMEGGGKGRPSRFEGIFGSLVRGHRAGTAYHELLRYLYETSDELATYADEDARREVAGEASLDDAARLKQKANLWMLRQDLAGYLLLGDPAVTLPLSRGDAAAARPRAPEVATAAPAAPVAQVAPAPAAQAPKPEPAPAAPAPKPEPPAAPAAYGASGTDAATPAAAQDAASMEDAAVALLEAERAIAERHGVTREVLRSWVAAYSAAGRGALEKLV